jgi:hypothetical protein
MIHQGKWQPLGLIVRIMSILVVNGSNAEDQSQHIGIGIAFGIRFTIHCQGMDDRADNGGDGSHGIDVLIGKSDEPI